MKFNFSSSLSFFDSREVSGYARELEEYRTYLQKVVKTKRYAFPESSLLLPDDAQVYKNILQGVHSVSLEKLRYVVVIGIGGSNLGTKAVYEALNGYADTLETDRFPKILFVDTLHEQWIAKVCDLFSRISDSRELLILIISKSGTTLETIAGAEILLGAMRHMQNVSERVAVITNNDSKLWQHALKRKWRVLEIPLTVGGRFSVLSPVGLFPLEAAGYDIDGLRRGALAMREKCLNESFKKNPAIQSALTLFLNYKRGVVIHNTFLFSPQLESLGKWYRQLLGESIGKEYDLDGKKVNVGIAPMVSIGSTDLHSVAQLYLGGPKNIFTTFVRVRHASRVRVPEHGAISSLVKGVKSRSCSVIMDALLDGTQAAYTKADLPFAECVMEGIVVEELGAFFQWKMIEIMYLGRLFNINAFDQPNVESYKIESRRRL